MVYGTDPDALRLGLLLPLSGPLALAATSALDAACLAASEVNESGGERGRAVELILVDAGADSRRAAAETRALADAGLVDAFVGLHTSDVHRAIEAELGGSLPYIFTPPHEGGSRLPGVVTLGDSPSQQLGPALDALAKTHPVRRWAMIGSDYIWAWFTHQAAASHLRAVGASVVSSRFVPFGITLDDADALVEELGAQRVDALLLSLIGSDLALFNRSFARAGVGDRIVRLSGSLEENGLLAAGGDDTGALYSAMRSFVGQDDERRRGLAENYHRMFGDYAPVLDAYSESCYDGVHLAVALASMDALSVSAAPAAARYLLSQNDDEVAARAWRASPVGPPRQQRCLARAEELDFTVVLRY
jgi:ABC-type branched-subunit amino acid transport system substrate-binding protein